MPKHFVIMAGGTGGHVIPGLSVATLLQKQGYSVSWIGTENGIEKTLVPESGIDIDYIDIAGVRGKGMFGLLLAPFRIVKAVMQCISILKRRKPSLVLGFGGFVAGPGGVAAKLLSVPLVIHEQNARAGTTNKILSRLASVVLQAFPDVFARKSEIYTVGNPVRSDICMIPNVSEGNKLNVLVVGGSLGALAINNIMPEVKKALGDKVALKHQVGKRHFDTVKEQYKQQSISDVEVFDYIADMKKAYEWADVVICRSGAMTVSELACASKPAIFIPFPFAIDDHQTSNAKWLVDAGAAELLPQDDMSVDVLADKLENFASDKARLMVMAKNAQAIAIADAAEQVVKHCERVSV